MAAAQKSQATWQETACGEAPPPQTQVLLASFLTTFPTRFSSLPLLVSMSHNVLLSGHTTFSASGHFSAKDAALSGNPSLPTPAQGHVFLPPPSSPHSPCTKPACALGWSLFYPDTGLLSLSTYCVPWKGSVVSGLGAQSLEPDCLGWNPRSFL